MAVSGPRLHQTVAQQRGVVYGPNTFPTIRIQENRRRLDISLNRNSTKIRKFVLGAGECADMKITLHNTGPGEIDDIWILHGPSVWLNVGQTGLFFLLRINRDCVNDVVEQRRHRLKHLISLRLLNRTMHLSI